MCLAEQTPEESGFEKVYVFASKRHNLPILRVLLGHPHGIGFNALQKACSAHGQITPRILSQRLKELEKQKLVSKGLVFGTPPKIEYRIQPKAEGLKKILEGMEEWGKKELA